MLYTLFCDPVCAAGRWSRTLVFGIARATRSELVHCAIGDGTIVLEQTRVGPRVYPFDAYVMACPGLRWWVEVPADPPDLRRLAETRAPGLITPIASWLSRGVVPSRDCVQIVRATLAWVGQPVPRRVTTPGRLFKHLCSEGFHAEPVA